MAIKGRVKYSGRISLSVNGNRCPVLLRMDYSGNMDTLFFVPGMWSGKVNFTNFVKYFTSNGYRCVTPVLKYHNLDPARNPDPLLGKTSITEYVDDLEREYQKIDGPAAIVGHSMGGLLAQLLAARVHPERLILLASAPPLGINALSRTVVKSFLGIFFKPFFWRRACRISFKSARYAIMNNLKPEKQRSEYQKFIYESGKAILEIGLPLFDKNKASYVNSADIRCPVLVIHGRLDRIVPYVTGQKIASKYKDVSTFKLMDNNAHLLQLEDGWEDIAGCICSWL